MLESVLVLHLLVLSLHMHVSIAIVRPRRLEQQTIPLRVFPLLGEARGGYRGGGVIRSGVWVT